MTTEDLQAALDRLDQGVLLAGAHAEGDQFCALEFDSQVRGRAWSDEPVTLPDLRPLNDGPWSSNAARTAALLPVMAALWEWGEWTPDRRQRWVTQVVLETVRQIVSALPGVPDAVRETCRTATTLEEAREAARAAGATAAGAAWAAWAAREAAAAEAAAGAARAAGAAAGAAAEAAAKAAAGAARAAWAAAGAEAVLARACQIWITAAEETA